MRRLVEDGKPVQGLSQRDYIAIAAEMMRMEPTLKRFPGTVLIYFTKARHLSVEPRRVLACASLLVAAEFRLECYLPPGKTVSLFPYESLATWFGVARKNVDRDEIAALYRKARQAMQQVDAAAAAAHRKEKRLLELLQKHNDALPLQLRRFCDRIPQHIETLNDLLKLLIVYQYRDLDPPNRNLLSWKRPKDLVRVNRRV